MIIQLDWTRTSKTSVAKICVDSTVTALSRSLVEKEREEKQVRGSLITYTPCSNSWRTDISVLCCEHRGMKSDISVTGALTVMCNVSFSGVL